MGTVEPLPEFSMTSPTSNPTAPTNPTPPTKIKQISSPHIHHLSPLPHQHLCRSYLIEKQEENSILLHQPFQQSTTESGTNATTNFHPPTPILSRSLHQPMPTLSTQQIANALSKIR